LLGLLLGLTLLPQRFEPLLHLLILMLAFASQLFGLLLNVATTLLNLLAMLLS
jgi:hypothetical protein